MTSKQKTLGVNPLVQKLQENRFPVEVNHVVGIEALSNSATGAAKQPL